MYKTERMTVKNNKNKIVDINIHNPLQTIITQVTKKETPTTQTGENIQHEVFNHFF